MKIVYLICGTRRSPEQSESYMREGALLRSSGGPVLPLHHAVICCGTAKRDPIPFFVRARTRKGAAASNSAFEVVDIGRFEVCTRRLIVAAILVQPRNRIRIGATVRSHRLLIKQRRIPGPYCKCEYGQRARFQDISATVASARIGNQVHRCTFDKRNNFTSIITLQLERH